MIFLFAAIMYVDGTDLLLCIKYISYSDENFFDFIRKAVMDWGLLVQATCGSLNKEKCYVSINSFRFVQGKVVLKKARELPLRIPMIPQLDGIDVPIPIIYPTTSKKTLDLS